MGTGAAHDQRPAPIVAQFGHYVADYPRNVVMRRAFTAAGAEVVELHDETRWPVRTARLLARALRTRPAVIVVSFPGYSDMPTARVAARLVGARVVFDPFIGLTETSIEDQATIAAGSWKGRFLALLERTALRSADLVLADTDVHGEYYRKIAAPRRLRLIRLPVATTIEERHRPSVPSSGPVTVVQYSNYLPLQGTECVVLAAGLVGTDVVFTLVGSGPTRVRCERLAEELGIDRITFVDRLPFDELRRVVGRSDIALGLFGTSPKTGRVVANKVVDALCEEVAVITTDSAAVREFLTDSIDAVLVPPDDPTSLAAAIDALASDPVRRRRIASAGRQRFEDSFSLAALTPIVAGILARPGEAA